MLSLNVLLLVVVVAGGVWFWHRSLSARERANRAAMEACERMGLQFLDGTVAFATLKLARDHGWLRLRRTYVFDYTAASIERRQGFVVMLADRVETIGFAQEEDARTGTAAPDIVQASPGQNGAGKVLDLAEWRRKHRHSDDPPPASRNTLH